MPRISIITPSFNHAHFIGKTIESVHSQQPSATGTFELEHIVVDGGSTDGTLDILRSYGDKLRFVSEKDEGQADALNKGLAMATGDIIGWLNSDDLYEPACLAAVAEAFATPQTQWVYGKVRVIDAEGREIRRWITAYKNHRMRPYSYRRLMVENWISQMGVFWRRDAGREVGPFRKDLHYCMDYDYWLRLGARWDGQFIDRYLGCFRWYATSKSGAGFGKQFREELAVARNVAATLAAEKGSFAWPLLMHRVNVAKIVAAYTVMGLFRR